MSAHWQLGSAGEWAAAFGTSAAVILSALTIRGQRIELREREALNVFPIVGPVGGPPSKDGKPITYMLVSTNNGGTRTIQNVRLQVLLDGKVVAGVEWDEIPPLTKLSERRIPDEIEFSREPGRMFRVIVEATFLDLDGRMWLRDSEGRIRLLKGKRQLLK